MDRTEYNQLLNLRKQVFAAEGKLYDYVKPLANEYSKIVFDDDLMQHPGAAYLEIDLMDESNVGFTVMEYQDYSYSSSPWQPGNTFCIPCSLLFEDNPEAAVRAFAHGIRKDKDKEKREQLSTEKLSKIKQLEQQLKELRNDN